MDKYEISLWEDYPDLTSNNIPFLNEGKICVIGSDTMTTAARALEPKLISNVNGTHIFTFRIYYRYKDEITGEEKINPYLPYLINERKVKVLWKKKWYDLVIKKIEEDTQKRSVLCTCEDLFITELSKNGYELEFNSELQNNSGTAQELMGKVLDGSGWRPAAEQDRIIQYQEEPVYEVTTINSFIAIKQSPSGLDENISIPKDKLCLLYQSCLDESCVNIQFLYSDEGYATEVNDMLVLNGDCCTFVGKIVYSGNYATITNNSGTKIFEFNINDSYSSDYRAKRLVNSQVTVFDELLGRYVDVYTDRNGNDIYGYETTEYSDPTLVVNLIANSKDFKDTKGWIGNDITWKLSPSFTLDSSGKPYYNIYSNDEYIIDDVVLIDETLPTYEAKSYLQVSSGSIYNTAFVSNRSFLNPSSIDIKNGRLGGFQKDEKYIFRYKAKSQLTNSKYMESGITGNVYKFKINAGNYVKDGDAYFSFSDSSFKSNGNWVEYTLTCVEACPANELDQIGFFIDVSNLCYIEEIQFFKLAYGKTHYKLKDTDPEPTEERINPGEIALQSIANVVYRYYNPDHDGVKDPKDLKFIYQGITKSNDYTPKYNNYEKITSIEVSKSNRFNILQSIAEKFECWVRFIINHDEETGQVLYDEDGLPQKYVQLVEQIGNDTGISFEYGIDLKGVKRSIISNTIATKAIIIPNENEFGKHGFCTIARSQLNYCRENFILNFDYYIQQGLLDKDTIEADLYKTNNGHLGYYFKLNKWNKRYDALADEINNKQTELIKQKAEYKVQVDNLRASEEKLTDSISDLILLAGVSTLAAAQQYAVNHVTNRKVQSLMGAIGKLRVSIRNLSNSIGNLKRSIQELERFITATNDEMNGLVKDINLLHEKFFRKYSRFIQEGTWQDQNYIYDDDYYLDALEVAYRSSRPQIQYDISLLRLSGLEDFSSKVFDLGDICYVQDKEFFGYEKDGITPYKQRIIISQLTSFFDTPEKDIIKVQNYKTQFDDLFQRITTATQALQFSEGRFERAAGVVKPDKTLSFGLLQDTFDYNKDLVLNSANQQVTWDNTGITVSDETNSALKVKIMAGGIFASSDGGQTWKNALRGDGISTDLLTAGRINTSEIYMYDGDHPSFRWDSQGINAYTENIIYEKQPNGSYELRTYPFSKYVRFDQFGLYGYAGTEDFVPETENEIWDEPDTRFGLTWKGFFFRGESDSASLQIINEQDGYGNDQITFKMGSSDYVTADGQTIASSIEISTDNDIILKTGDINRVQIGRYKYQRVDENGTPQYYIDSNEPIIDTDYGIFVRDSEGNDIFTVSAGGVDSIGGWNLTADSFYHSVDKQGTEDKWGTVGFYSTGKLWTIDGPEETNPIYDATHQGSGQTQPDQPDQPTDDSDEIILIDEIIESENIDTSHEVEKVQGHRDIYYILAGNKFGVTLDGRVYSAGGRIGGWEIGENTLTANTEHGSITIDSSGKIYSTITYDDNDSNKIISGWEINADGTANFYNVISNIGTIAGWHITENDIYNDKGTHLNSNNLDQYGNFTYTIVTDSIAAYGGTIGGCTINPSGISGDNWQLTSTGGTIGGWKITQYGIYSQPQGGYQTLLDPNGSLQFKYNGNVAKVFEYQTGIIGIDPNLHVTGIITAGGQIRSNTTVAALEFTFSAPTESLQPITLDRTDALNIKELNGKEDNDTTGFDDTHISYLKWLHKNWKHITPSDVGL